MTAGFVGGGGAWSLETLHAGGSSAFWIAEWDVWNQNAPDQRIWRTIYSAGLTTQTQVGTPPDVTAHAAELLESLTTILRFSEAERCDPFTEMFRKAIAALSDHDMHGYHRDLAPPGVLTETELRVLDACQLASVFGGMGSWNDLGFEGTTQHKYQAVSDRLFAAITTSILAAVNSWLHRRPDAA